MPCLEAEVAAPDPSLRLANMRAITSLRNTSEHVDRRTLLIQHTTETCREIQTTEWTIWWTHDRKVCGSIQTTVIVKNWGHTSHPMDPMSTQIDVCIPGRAKRTGWLLYMCRCFSLLYLVTTQAWVPNYPEVDVDRSPRNRRVGTVTTLGIIKWLR